FTLRPPPRSTLFPYTTLFRSNDVEELDTYVYTKESLEFKTVEFHQAKSKAIEEILDNCIDEFYRGLVSEVRTTLSDDGEEVIVRSEEHTSELQSRENLVCRLL